MKGLPTTVSVQRLDDLGYDVALHVIDRDGQSSPPFETLDIMTDGVKVVLFFEIGGAQAFADAVNVAVRDGKATVEGTMVRPPVRIADPR